MVGQPNTNVTLGLPAAIGLAWLLIAGCDSFVEGVEDPVELIPDDRFTDESQIDLIVNGLEWQFAYTYANLATRGGWLSDELDFNQGTFAESSIDRGEIPFDNSQTNRLHRFMGQLRAQAHDLRRRSGEIEYVDPENQRKVLYAAHFYEAVARYFLAAFGGLNPTEGGGVITIDPREPGPFIPSSTLYDQALDHLESARVRSGDREQRIVNTLAARIRLIKEEFAAAREAAADGLGPGDEPFLALFAANTPNEFYITSGPGRQNWVFGDDFADLVVSNPEERNRIPLATTIDADSTIRYYQNRYTERADPLPFATWQENELILAEVDLRAGDSGTALSRVNTVRASYGISPLESINLAVLEEERRKELWGTGLRLIDQRRFGSWHLGPGTWQYFPIPQAERDINPNL